ncbi:hypothetical protein [Gellertiella hungarica]|uniref:Uncharacterized protein n=1 Tax=Gellertiella hungarica TaxID=1572859 RepID=A0A7W6NLC8_9HYPH|nr:hypothetical protein [Gellertiella hungarica]MBB4065290.1 hypothetical protein [Gellertiella hungarica]
METTPHATRYRLAAIILQDHKRLPARFFAFSAGAINGRAR